jgi:hypothetical protein
MTTYKSDIDLNLTQVPTEIDDSLVYSELLDIHNALEILAANYSGGGGGGVSDHALLTNVTPNQHHSISRYNILDYGGVRDGVTNNQPVIQLLIATITTLSNGGVIYFPPGVYAISSDVIVTDSNVTLVGAGGGGRSNVSGSDLTAAAATVFTPTASWTGTYLVRYNPAGTGDDGTGKNGIYAGGIKGIGFRCSDVADGIEVRSCTQSVFEDLTVESAVNVCIYIASLATLISYTDVQRCMFINIYVRSYTGKGFHITDANGDVATALPNAAGNVSFCVFNNIGVEHKADIGIAVGDTDNNNFQNLYVRNIIGEGTPTVNGIELRGAAFDGDTAVARYNSFFQLECSTGFVAKGPAFTTSSFNKGSHNNTVLHFSRSNGTDAAIVENGAHLVVLDSGQGGDISPYQEGILSGLGSIQVSDGYYKGNVKQSTRPAFYGALPLNILTVTSINLVESFTYIFDTTTAEVGTLPASPLLSSRITITRGGTGALTIAGNGNNIIGVPNFIISSQWETVELMFTQLGWVRL